MIDGVPKSETAYSAARSDPAAIAGRITGSVTRRNASSRPWFSVRAASISVVSNEERGTGG